MNKCVNVVGINNYSVRENFRIGREYALRHEPNNIYDTETVVVELLDIDGEYNTVGHVANSVKTMVMGCSSAGNICEYVADNIVFAVCKFIKDDIIILELL